MLWRPTCHGIDKKGPPNHALRNGLSNQSLLDPQGEGSVNQLSLIKAIIGGLCSKA